MHTAHKTQNLQGMFQYFAVKGKVFPKHWRRAPSKIVWCQKKINFLTFLEKVLKLDDINQF